MSSGRTGKERRKTPRGACRLPCSVLRGRERLRARVLDVSEGGLCLLSPVWLKAKQQFEITIDVPGAGQSRVRA
ncbi:MAG TPA: PilZ domain-containing protein, partial [Deltaproteobacteria bacterium]|nr:PilZ domain-containing protein [Deltaproteobacteria bacterium]